MSSTPDPVNLHVARRLRRRRSELGLTPRDLDKALGVSPGTVERLERGTRPIGAGQLFQLGHALGVPVPFFFRGLRGRRGRRDRRRRPAPGIVEEGEAFLGAYARVRDPALRKDLLRLIKSIRGIRRP